MSAVQPREAVGREPGRDILTHRRSRRPRRNGRLVAMVTAAVVVLAGVTVVLVGAFSKSGSSSPPGAGSTPSSPTNSPAASGSASPAAWSADQLRRFDAASALIASKKGHVGIVVEDRRTGLVWRGGEPTTLIWAGSTPKLAFALALREQARSGGRALDANATKQIAAMLSVSDNQAADSLWDRYAGSDPNAWMTRFHAFGMTTATYVNGFPKRWGFVKCSAQDLVGLMDYILTKANPDDRAYLVNAMRTVGDIQHWGVWGAGAALQPGVKDGWSVEKDDGKDHWITATVGFAGPDQQYSIGAMYHQLPGGDSIQEGVHTLTDLVATVFGAPVPAPVVIPPPDS
jgi:beta-lactamase class A